MGAEQTAYSESPLAVLQGSTLGSSFDVNPVLVAARINQLRAVLAAKIASNEILSIPSLDTDGRALQTFLVLTTEDQATVRGGSSDVSVTHETTFNEQGLMVASRVIRSGSDAIPTTESIYIYKYSR